VLFTNTLLAAIGINGGGKGASLASKELDSRDDSAVKKYGIPVEDVVDALKFSDVDALSRH
jgi:hypothetical protein